MSQKLITLRYDRKPQLEREKQKTKTQLPILYDQKPPTIKIANKQIPKNHNHQTKLKEITPKPLPKNFQPNQNVVYTPSTERKPLPKNPQPSQTIEYTPSTEGKLIPLNQTKTFPKPKQSIKYNPPIEGKLIPLKKEIPTTQKTVEIPLQEQVIPSRIVKQPNQPLPPAQPNLITKKPEISPQLQTPEQPTQIIQTPQPVTVFQPFPVFQPPLLSKEEYVSPVYGLGFSSNERYRTRYAPSLSEKIKNRLKYLFEPIVSNVSYREIGHKYIFSPTQGYRQRTNYRPLNYKEFVTDRDYEPVLIENTLHDFSPQEIEEMSYAPQITQESYPVYNYSVYGLPDTYVNDYAPILHLRLKPITDFEIKLRPRVISFNHSYQSLLNNLLNKVI